MSSFIECHSLSLPENIQRRESHMIFGTKIHRERQRMYVPKTVTRLQTRTRCLCSLSGPDQRIIPCTTVSGITSMYCMNRCSLNLQNLFAQTFLQRSVLNARDFKSPCRLFRMVTVYDLEDLHGSPTLLIRLITTRLSDGINFQSHHGRCHSSSWQHPASHQKPKTSSLIRCENSEQG